MLLLLAVSACRSAPAELTSAVRSAARGQGGSVSRGQGGSAAQGSAPRFSVPPDYVRRSLRGEGSESLLAPAAATVSSTTGGAQVLSDPLALEVHWAADQLPASRWAPPRGAGYEVVYSDESVLLVRGPAGAAARVLLELVPEWDSTETRHVACSTVGWGDGDAPRWVPQENAERVVASCLSLSLPALD
jgi:hypothetical protein